MILSALALLTVPARIQERHPSLTGDVQRIDHWHSSVLENDRNLAVYLPPDYDKQPHRRYPVLYMADGQNVFDGMTSFIPNQEWRCDESAEGLIRSRAIPPMIIVAIDNGGVARADEYLATRAKISENGPMAGGKADLYAKMLLTEIKPLIDTRFRTKTGRQDTAVGGSSLGGILSLYLGLTHPDAISRVLAVSPSIWWDDRAMIKQIDALPHRLPLKIWIDIGTKESPTAEANARDAADALAKKGWTLGKDLLFFVDEDAQHNERAWAHRFPMMLLFLYR